MTIYLAILAAFLIWGAALTLVVVFMWAATKGRDMRYEKAYRDAHH